MNRTRSRSKSIRLLEEGRVATLCIHGDEPGAVATAALVRQVLAGTGSRSAHSGTVRADGPGRRESGRLSPPSRTTGRPGYAAWGVSAGGAFDRGSAELANALLGNSPDCAVLELTLVGGTYQAEGPLALALAGAPIEARIVRANRRSIDFRCRRASRFGMVNGSCWVIRSRALELTSP